MSDAEKCKDLLSSMKASFQAEFPSGEICIIASTTKGNDPTGNRVLIFPSIPHGIAMATFMLDEITRHNISPQEVAALMSRLNCIVEKCEDSLSRERQKKGSLH